MANEEVISISPACSLDRKVKQREEVSRNKEGDEVSDPMSSYTNKAGEAASRISEDETIKALPEDMVEKILSMVPFPFIFQARILSKSWLARLSPISSQADEENKHLAMEFQRKVSERSSNWPTFSPVIYNGDYFAHERGSQTWRKLPPLDFIPLEVRLTGLTVEGTLLLFPIPLFQSQVQFHIHHGHRLEFCVANILTRQYRILPGLSTDTGSSFYRLVSHSWESYKMISVHASRAYDGSHRIYVYDSKSAAWSLTQEVVLAKYGAINFGREPQTFGPVEYVDGILYVLRIPFGDTAQVLAIDVKEERSEVLDISLEAISDYYPPRYPPCQGNESDDYPLYRRNPIAIRSQEEYILFKLDLGLRRSVEVARGCQRDFEESSLAASDNLPRFFYLVVDDGHEVFYPDERREAYDDESKMLAYNVHREKWRCFPYPLSSRIPSMATSYSRWPYWIGSLFRPGFNPFAEV